MCLIKKFFFSIFIVIQRIQQNNNTNNNKNNNNNTKNIHKLSQYQKIIMKKSNLKKNDLFINYRLMFIN